VGQERGEAQGRRHQGVAVGDPPQHLAVGVVDGKEQQGQVGDPGDVEAAVEPEEHEQQREEPEQ
jgi:hypothetical protein